MIYAEDFPTFCQSEIPNQHYGVDKYHEVNALVDSASLGAGNFDRFETQDTGDIDLEAQDSSEVIEGRPTLPLVGEPPHVMATLYTTSGADFADNRAEQLQVADDDSQNSLLDDSNEIPTDSWAGLWPTTANVWCGLPL